MTSGNTDRPASREIPVALTQAILAGNCVAFVGAGFSAAAFPTWKKLLLEIADTAQASDAERIKQVLKAEAPRDIDFVAAAEMLRWGAGAKGSTVVKLHGDITKGKSASLVLSRRDYRRRLYSDISYASFLRAVFATSTVLYLGYSFSDSYLNEMRSEILALLVHQPPDRPIAYAIANDVPEAEATYFKRHEGVEILRYDTRNGNFSGFDDYLEGIYNLTNPQLHLGGVLSGRRILWVDPQRENNEFGIDYLRAAAKAGLRPCIIDTAASWEDAIEDLGRQGTETDLVLTHWGHGRAIDKIGRGCAVAERLLSEIRQRDVRVPVIVFASGDHANENRQAALKLGALAFVSRWQTLFHEIAKVFQSGIDAG